MKHIEKYKTYKNIICIDLKSFYASVECILRDLDPFTTPLVVADKSIGKGAIVLAITPYLKKLGVKTRCRIKDLPKDIDIIYARPQMQKYIDYSAEVINIYLDFVAREDLYVYSIDEAFLDVSSYLNLYKLDDVSIAKKILSEITKRLGLTAVAGVGPNMLMAKLAMDIDAKKSEDFVSKWHYEDIKDKLWNITPLSKMWGIGRRMEHHLNLLGCEKIGDIPKLGKDFLKQKFGVLGEELYYHTYGIDQSQIQDQEILTKRTKSFGVGQVLSRDYNEKEIVTILLEMTDDVTRRMRAFNKSATTIHLSIAYSSDLGGFSRQMKLDNPTNFETVIFNTLIDIFNFYYEDNMPIKNVGIALSDLVENNVYQYNMFEDYEKLNKEHIIQTAIDKIKIKYGKNSVIRLTSKEKHATAIKRNKQIGGHHV